MGQGSLTTFPSSWPASQAASIQRLGVGGPGGQVKQGGDRRVGEALLFFLLQRRGRGGKGRPRVWEPRPYGAAVWDDQQGTERSFRKEVPAGHATTSPEGSSRA